MAVGIGPKIGIDGEAAYRRSIQEIIEQGKTLKTEMESVASGYREAGDGMSDYEKKSKVLNDQISNQKDLIEKLKDAVAKSSQETGENSTTTQKWQQQLNKAQAELGKMESDLGKLTDGTEDFTQEEEEASEQTTTFGDVLKANLISEAIVSGLKKLADGVKEVAENMKEGFLGAVQWADDLAALSVQTGISTSTLQEWEYAAGLLDVDVNTLTKSNQKLIKSMSSAAGGSQQQADAFAKLGVSITDSNGHLRDSESVLYDVVDALGGIDNETERDALAMELLGKSAQELNPLIEAGSDALKAFGDEAQETGYVLDEDAISKLNETQDAMDRLKNAGDGLTRNLSAEFAPLVAGAFETVLPYVQEFGTTLAQVFSGEQDPSSIFEMITTAVNNIALSIQENLPTILQQGSMILTTLLQGISSTLPTIVQTIVPIITMIIETILQNLPLLLTTGVSVLLSLVDGISSALPQLIPAAVEAVLQLTESLVEQLPLIIETGITLLISLIQGLSNAIPKLVTYIPTIITTIVNVLTQNLPQIISAAIPIITSLINGLIQALPQLIAMTPQIIMTIVSTLAQNLPQIISAGAQLLVSLVQGIVSMIGQIAVTAKQIGKEFLDRIKTLPSQVVSIGSNIVKGIFDGISNATSWVKSKIKGWVGDVVGFFKGFLGIHSPSKVFADTIGSNMALGIGEGFEDEMVDVTRNMESAIPTTFGVAGSARQLNMGGVSIVVNGAEGQDVEELANLVMYKMQSAVQRREAVFA